MLYHSYDVGDVILTDEESKMGIDTSIYSPSKLDYYRR
jgi:hypothetical protein